MLRGWRFASTRPLNWEFVQIFPRGDTALYLNGHFIHQGKYVRPWAWREILDGKEDRSRLLGLGCNPDRMPKNPEAAEATRLIANLFSFAAPQPMPWYYEHAELSGAAISIVLLGIISLLFFLWL